MAGVLAGLSASELHGMWLALDPECTGRVPSNTWTRKFRSATGCESVFQIIKAFRILDEDDDGWVEEVEFKAQVVSNNDPALVSLSLIHI